MICIKTIAICRCSVFSQRANPIGGNSRSNSPIGARNCLLGQTWCQVCLCPHHLLTLYQCSLLSQGAARKRNQRIPGLGETDALRYEDLQAAAQKISEPHPRHGNDESGVFSRHQHSTFKFNFLVLYQLAQGYMQAVGGVGRSGGNGKTNNYLTEIIGPFFRRKW